MNRFHATAFLCLAIASSACSAQDIKDVEANRTAPTQAGPSIRSILRREI